MCAWREFSYHNLLSASTEGTKTFSFALLFDLLCGLEKANFRNLISLFYLCQPVVGNEKRRIKLSVGEVFIKTKAVMSRVAKISSKKHKAGTVQDKRHMASESEHETSFSDVSHSWNRPRNWKRQSHKANKQIKINFDLLGFASTQIIKIFVWSSWLWHLLAPPIRLEGVPRTH